MQIALRVLVLILTFTASAQAAESLLVVGAKLLFSRDVAIPAGGLEITESVWCRDLENYLGNKAVVSARLQPMVANGESVPATVIKAGSIFEMAPYSALDAAGYTNVDRDFVNLTNSQDRITLRAVNWRGSCHLPMNEVVEGLRKIGVRIRNSAH